MMRRNVTFVITLVVMALAAIGITSLVNAHSITSDAIGAESDEQLPPAEFSPTSEPRDPVEITDLVPELPDEQKTQVVFEDEDGNLTSFYVAYRDHDAVNELISQYGTLIAIYEPLDRLYPDGNVPPELLQEPVPTSDPNFVHPEVVMPPAPPEPGPPAYELLEMLEKQEN
jgi:hypothetical protein